MERWRRPSLWWISYEGRIVSSTYSLKAVVDCEQEHSDGAHQPAIPFPFRSQPNVQVRVVSCVYICTRYRELGKALRVADVVLEAILAEHREAAALHRCEVLRVDVECEQRRSRLPRRLEHREIPLVRPRPAAVPLGGDAELLGGERAAAESVELRLELGTCGGDAPLSTAQVATREGP